VEAVVVKVPVPSKSLAPPFLWEDLEQEVRQNIINKILRIERLLGSH
jgi:hypothetical protein